MTPQTILVADDDRAIRAVLDQALARAGHQVQATDNASTLWQWIKAGEGDLVITDVVMPDANGLDLIPHIHQLRPELNIIVMSAQSTLMTAIKATERGAFEYLPKPFDLDELVNTVERALNDTAQPGAGASPVQGLDENLPLVGRSPAMQDIYRAIARLMATDLTVMVSGESGTGKELVARALHEYGKRSAGPFIALNMAAIPRELVESELFGHEKGAFTGAVARGVGRFTQARGGTLFLDEIGDMPLEAQTRLLRVLQDGEFTTVGGRDPIHADVRIIAATHRDLTQQVQRGKFREDLFYRLNVVPMRLPPLRERREDIADLVRHFLDRATGEGLETKTFDDRAMSLLAKHDWPGNVRELENFIQRVIVLYPDEILGGDIVTAELGSVTMEDVENGSQESGLGPTVERHLTHFFRAHRNNLPAPGLYERVLREIERPLISLALDATSGNQLQAARMLGLNRNTLRKKIRELKIKIVRGMK